MKDVQQKFEELATSMGYPVRKKQDGAYAYDHTNKLWSWYSAGAEAGSCVDVMHLADPNFMMAGGSEKD